MPNGFMFTSSSTILSFVILSSYIWFYVNSAIDHLSQMVTCHLVLCHFVHLPNGHLANLSCASWSFSISSSDGVVPFQIVLLAVGL